MLVSKNRQLELEAQMAKEEATNTRLEIESLRNQCVRLESDRVNAK